MSGNVISLSRHQKNQARRIGALDALLGCFAKQRRSPEEVYWLKENAEILNILESTHTPVQEGDLESYAQFYQNLPERITFFPQYYRFFCSIALDLEALGQVGNVGEALCARVRQAGLAEAEMSDLQRAEAMRLLARRGFALQGTDTLLERLHRFMNTSATFALPNYKTAYELTHIVFYLSEYGRRDPRLSKRALQSLIFAGLIAHLEENADLLAEICIALRFAGQEPPTAWDRLVADHLRGFRQTVWSGERDDYHAFLMTSWASAIYGKPLFQGYFTNASTAFYGPPETSGTLHALSTLLHNWPQARSHDWLKMKARLLSRLSLDQAAHLCDVEASTDQFGAFFEIFARAPMAETGNSDPKRDILGAQEHAV